MDGTKFDLLSERLSQLFVTEGLGYEQYMKMTSSLSICLLKLCNYLTDDYQLKSLNLKVFFIVILDFTFIKTQSSSCSRSNFNIYGQVD